MTNLYPISLPQISTTSFYIFFYLITLPSTSENWNNQKLIPIELYLSRCIQSRAAVSIAANDLLPYSSPYSCPWPQELSLPQVLRRLHKCSGGQPPDITGKWPSANDAPTEEDQPQLPFFLIGFPPMSTYWINYLYKNCTLVSASRELNPGHIDYHRPVPACILTYSGFILSLQNNYPYSYLKIFPTYV